MAISDNYIPIRQLGNGSTTQFSSNWAVIAAAYLTVFFEDAVTGVQTAVSPSLYTLVFNNSGFTVTFNTAPTSANYVVIGRDVALDQIDPYRTSKGFQGEVIEASFDKLTAISQDLSDASARSLKFPLGSTANGILPVPVDDLTFAWDGTAGKVKNGPSATTIANAVTTTTSNAAAAAASAGAAASSASSASSSATAASGSVLLASQWASLITGQVASTDYSSKAWAIGGTGVSGATNNGSAKEWAVSGTSPDGTTSKSSKSYATDSSVSAAAAAASAAAAAGLTSGTSTTSNTIGTGSKTFITQTGLNFAPGQSVNAVDQASTANNMNGIVTAYNSGTGSLTFVSSTANGSGTKTAWNLAVSALAGNSEVVLLGSATASASSSLDYLSMMTTAYAAYFMIIDNLIVSANCFLGLRTSLNNSTFDSTANHYNSTVRQVAVGAGTEIISGYGSGTSMQLTDTLGLTNKINGRIDFVAGLDTGGQSQMFRYSGVSNGSWDESAGQNNTSATIVNAVQLLPSAGNFTSGTVYLFGVKNT